MRDTATATVTVTGMIYVMVIGASAFNNFLTVSGIVFWGYDPLWWGIVNVTVIMIGLFCPPIGLNVMVMSGLVRDVPLRCIYVGILPYLLADFLRLGLLVAFPVIGTWLPSVLR